MTVHNSHIVHTIDHRAHTQRPSALGRSIPRRPWRCRVMTMVRPTAPVVGNGRGAPRDRHEPTRDGSTPDLSRPSHKSMSTARCARSRRGCRCDERPNSGPADVGTAPRQGRAQQGRTNQQHDNHDAPGAQRRRTSARTDRPKHTSRRVAVALWSTDFACSARPLARARPGDHHREPFGTTAGGGPSTLQR